MTNRELKQGEYAITRNPRGHEYVVLRMKLHFLILASRYSQDELDNFGFYGKRNTNWYAPTKPMPTRAPVLGVLHWPIIRIITAAEFIAIKLRFNDWGECA